MSFRIGLAALSLVAATASATQSARAWGCVAEAGDGTTGYSYNYSDTDAASERALNECAARTNSDETCIITDCVEGS